MARPCCAMAVAALLCAISGLAVAGDLHMAARKGETAQVSTLLAGGADLNEQDGEGATPLFTASGWGRTEIVKMLLAAGADPLIAAKSPYGSGGTAIHIASQRGHVEIVEALLDHGVDPNLNDHRLGPPLHIARKLGNEDVADLLSARGAHPITATPVDGMIAGAGPALGERIGFGCKGCHDMAPEPSGEPKEGPTLWNIVGRDKASTEGYAYSDTLLEMPGTWTFADLNSLVADAMAYAPGTKMYGVAPIATDERRAALLLYLRGLADDPVPLP